MFETSSAIQVGKENVVKVWRPVLQVRPHKKPDIRQPAEEKRQSEVQFLSHWKAKGPLFPFKRNLNQQKEDLEWGWRDMALPKNFLDRFLDMTVGFPTVKKKGIWSRALLLLTIGNYQSPDTHWLREGWTPSPPLCIWLYHIHSEKGDVV